VDGATEQAATARREISIAELDERIADRAERPLIEWDGKMRMSVAGYQDKLLVYFDGQPKDGARMFLADFPLASTHILKPQPTEARLPFMVANEHFCMTLAGVLKLPVAPVAILRTPRPVLVVSRFDRTILPGAEVRVERQHIIDACQAADLPVSYKYERNIGSVVRLGERGAVPAVLAGRFRAALRHRSTLALARDQALARRCAPAC
jgi:serine/threonine-protein kinase HipA